MNICVYGAGAVGGSIAARLAASGNTVSVIARGVQLEAVRERGLVVLAGETRIAAQVRAVADPAELGPQGLVIVTVKGHQLPAIAAPLGRMLESGAYVVFAMNGILWWFADGLPLRLQVRCAESLDPGGELRRRIPPERIVGAVVNSANEVIEPGVIRNTSPQRNRLVLGPAKDEAQSIADVTAIAAVLARAGYEAPVTADIRQEIWNKLALYVGVSSLAALTHCTLDRLVGDPSALALMSNLMHETIAIGERLGFDGRGNVDEQLRFFHDKPVRPSLLQDFEQGREPELDGSILAVEAIAAALGVDAPRIRILATLLRLKAENLRARRAQAITPS
jgi:2-dehydropantoate 2-reductase